MLPFYYERLTLKIVQKKFYIKNLLTYNTTITKYIHASLKQTHIIYKDSIIFFINIIF